MPEEDSPFLVDDEARPRRGHAVELIGRVPVAAQRAESDLFLLEEFSGARVVARQVYRNDLEPAVIVLRVEFLEVLKLSTAMRSAGEPESQQDDLATVVGERDLLAVERSVGEG